MSAIGFFHANETRPLPEVCVDVPGRPDVSSARVAYRTLRRAGIGRIEARTLVARLLFAGARSTIEHRLTAVAA